MLKQSNLRSLIKFFLKKNKIKINFWKRLHFSSTMTHSIQSILTDANSQVKQDERVDESNEVIQTVDPHFSELNQNSLNIIRQQRRYAVARSLSRVSSYDYFSLQQLIHYRRNAKIGSRQERRVRFILV